MRGGLGPAATTRLPMPEQILDDVEGTFDLGALALTTSRFSTGHPSLVLRSDLRRVRFHRTVPMHRTALILDALFPALLTCVGQYDWRITSYCVENSTRCKLHAISSR